MLYAKFQDHRTFGSGEEEFLRFLPYMGMEAILVMCPVIFIKKNFLSHFPRRLHMKFGID